MKLERNMLVRALSGAVYVMVLTFTLLFGGQYSALLFALFACLACFEFLKTELKQVREIVPVLSGFALIAAIAFFSTQNLITGIQAFMLPSIIVLSFILFAYLRKHAYGTRLSLRILLGGGYIFTGMGLLWSIGQLNGGNFEYRGTQVLFVFILIWSSDTFAYLSGKRFGRHKLAPKISPGKTIEGLLGGMLATVLLSIWLGDVMCEFDTWNSITIAILVVISGSTGDLLESAWKRYHGIKDSGRMLPGHGGFLDRLDSAFLAGPVVFLWLQFTSA
jgi:phosphatidate cytidylyltransferase